MGDVVERVFSQQVTSLCVQMEAVSIGPVPLDKCPVTQRLGPSLLMIISWALPLNQGESVMDLEGALITCVRKPYQC